MSKQYYITCEEINSWHKTLATTLPAAKAAATRIFGATGVLKVGRNKKPETLLLWEDKDSTRISIEVESIRYGSDGWSDI